MSKNSMIAAALVAALIAIPSVASAQADDDARGEDRFKAADQDGNGTLSRQEVTASMPRLASQFDSLDANKDGQLSRDELRAARGGREKRG